MKKNDEWKSKTALRILYENAPRKIHRELLTISLEYKEIEKGEHPITNKNLRRTDGAYCVRYAPYDIRGVRTTAPYLIQSDLLFLGDKRYHDWSHFLFWCKKGIDGETWLKENTGLSKKLFDLAKAHPYTNIPFSIDYEAYRAKLEKGGKLKRKDFFREMRD